MKVVIINKSDSTGGAAIVSYRLMEALRASGIDAYMLVAEKKTDSPFVSVAAAPIRLKHAFMTERLNIFRALGFKRDNLWKVDTGDCGVPLWKHPLVRHADVVCLNWINQGFLSLRGVRRICDMGKPVVWTMHDMWCMTGICHHAGDCNMFTHRCGECPLMGDRAARDDLSHRIWEQKESLGIHEKIHYVAVSNWLYQRAMASSLLRDSDVRVIPNAFPIPDATEVSQRPPRPDNTVRIIMGAARLDDPIKGLPVLVEVTKLLAANPGGVKYKLLTYGRLKDPSALDDVTIPHTDLGVLNGPEALRDAYMKADIVVSTSHFETLPGTMVEGQAYGCIPVCFDRGGQRDIIDHMQTGYLSGYDTDTGKAAANIAAGIRWASSVVDDKDLRRRMYDSVVKKFAARSVATNYIRLFEDII